MAAHVRPIRFGDLPDLIAMCAEHAEYERAAFDPAGKAALLGDALFSASPRLWAWIARDNGRAIGYATAAREFSTWAARDYLHLDCLFLRASARGRGIGAMLLRAAAAAAAAQGIGELQWQTPDWNESAARFYRRFGATATAKIRFTLRLGDD